jgi:hypothetical protein
MSTPTEPEALWKAAAEDLAVELASVHAKSQTQMNELEKQFQLAAGELAGELAIMHGTLYNLIVALRNTEHSIAQSTILDAAWKELQASQKRFLSQYAGQIGGDVPENN